MPNSLRPSNFGRSTLVIAFLVASIGMVSTIAVIWTLNNRSIEYDKLRFENEVEISLAKIKDEISKFNFGLQGAKGLVVSHKAWVSREEFRNYAASRDFFSNFPGAVGFGFIRLVKDENLPEYVEKQRAGYPGFEMKPELKRPLHYVIELIEPLENNKAAVGLDIAFEKERLAAAELAIETGTLIISNRVALVQRHDRHAGFLLYLPVYRTAKTPATKEARVREAIGLVYTPIILEGMHNELQAVLPANLQVNFILGDGSEWPLHPGPFPYQSQLVNRKRTQLEFAGKIWTIEMSRGFEEGTSVVPYSYLFSLLGFLVSIGLGGMVYGRLKRRDEIFQDNSLWLSAIVNNSEVAIITSDLSGQVLMINEKASHLLALAPGAKINLLDHLSVGKGKGRVLSELALPLEERLSQFFQNLTKAGEEMNEVYFLNAKGEAIDISLSMGKIKGSNQEFMGYLLVANDIREKKSIQRKLERQKALVVENSKLALLGNMAGGVTHELNTPLAIILAKTQMMLDANEDGQESKAYFQEGLTMIEDSAKRINRFLKTLKWFTRNSHELVSYHYPSDLVKSALDLMADRLKTAGIELIVDLKADEPLSCRISEIAQALFNLLANSCEAIENLPERWIKISSESTPESYFFYVEDSGSGIPSEITKFMMNPFFSTKDPNKGSGMGLTISRGIAEAHKGQIEYLTNRPHTTFRLEISKNLELAAV